MKFKIKQEQLLSALQIVMGVVERKQTMPILSHVLLNVADGKLFITGTDTEIEIRSATELELEHESGQITVSGRKFFDIVRTFNSKAELSVSYENQKVTLASGRSKFNLLTLGADEYPNVEDETFHLEFSLPQDQLKQIIEKTHFMMAQKNVRFYLNGMLWEISDDKFITVAMDGHRFAYTHDSLKENVVNNQRVIVPRKGVTELLRLLEDDNSEVKVKLGDNHVCVENNRFCFTSKLIEANYPDYRLYLKQIGEKQMIADKSSLKEILTRASVLVSDQFHSVRMELSPNLLKAKVVNLEQEQAEDELEVDYTDDPMVLGFNVYYLLDVLNNIEGDRVKFSLDNAEKGVFIEDAESSETLYFIMPLLI